VNAGVNNRGVTAFRLRLFENNDAVFPPWVTLLITVVLIAPMAGLQLSSKQPWLRIESNVTIAFVVLAAVGMVLDLKDLFVKMVTPPTGISGFNC
jgi:hypothetical protein